MFNHRNLKKKKEREKELFNSAYAENFASGSDARSALLVHTWSVKGPIHPPPRGCLVLCGDDQLSQKAQCVEKPFLALQEAQPGRLAWGLTKNKIEKPQIRSSWNK